MLTTSEPALGSLMAKRADVLAAHQLRQVLRLLRRAAVAVQLVDAQVRVRAVRQADRRRGARDLLHRDHVREIAEVACRRIPRSPSCHAGPGRRASSTGRPGTGCPGRSPRHAARSRRPRSCARCRAASRWFRRAREASALRARVGGHRSLLWSLKLPRSVCLRGSRSLSSSIICSRITNFCALPVIVIGISLTKRM